MALTQKVVGGSESVLSVRIVGELVNFSFIWNFSKSRMYGDM